jgi:GNAT superfamily N-acetyltransferase
MKVRAATAADAAAIARVHTDTWQTAFRGIVPDPYIDRTAAGYEQRKRAWESTLGAKNRTKIIGVAEDRSAQIVGFAVAGPERTGDPNCQGELEAIYVLQSHQRQGAGRALVSWAAARLTEAGFRSMLLWTLADSPYRRFYEALGGEWVRETEKDFGGVMLKVVAYGWSDIAVLTDAP